MWFWSTNFANEIYKPIRLLGVSMCRCRIYTRKLQRVRESILVWIQPWEKKCLFTYCRIHLKMDSPTCCRLLVRSAYHTTSKSRLLKTMYWSLNKSTVTNWDSIMNTLLRNEGSQRREMGKFPLPQCKIFRKMVISKKFSGVQAKEKKKVNNFKKFRTSPKMVRWIGPCFCEGKMNHSGRKLASKNAEPKLFAKNESKF